ncbi:cell division protein ZapA [Craurococcus roseus]|uniref:Cell division protein ZapA n=1 Tax=Craurococcus roseus TaxID=77585 RepID=A0ABP3PH16_9PROT
MGQVTVRVNGYSHTIGCKDGEEAHVFELVGQIENKAKLIRSMGGQFSEARMLLHVALLLADEAADLKAEVARLSAIAAGASVGVGTNDPRIADRLTRIAERIESIAGAFDAQAPRGAGRPGEAPGPGSGDDAPAAGRG